MFLIQNLVICRCEEVNLNSIINAIRQGSLTTKEVKLRTRAGMGICQGRTCRMLVEQIVCGYTKQDMPNSSSLTYNFPIRPVSLSDMVWFEGDS